MSIGMSYRPSSDAAAECFMAAWCSSCHWMNRGDDGCEVADAAMAFYDTYDDEYPSEWVYVDARPTCTGYLFASDDVEISTPRCDKTSDMFEVLG